MSINGNITPVISVLLPVHNAAAYITASVESILKQSFRDFELIIINDGSQDDSLKIISSFSDQRIVLVNNEKNIGLVASLNKGIKLAKGRYIARMDADDISLETRFALQVAFLETHPEVVLCGTNFYMLSNNGTELKQLPLSSSEIKTELLFRSPIAHPTVMMRKEILEQFALEYAHDCPSAEDYDLWTRMAKVAELANLPEALLTYRVHEMQVTKTKRDEKEATRHKVMWNYFSWFGIFPSDEEKQIQILVSDGKSRNDPGFLRAAEAWLKKIRAVLIDSGKIEKTSIEKVIARYWLKVCENSGAGRDARKIYTSSALSQKLSLRAWLKFHYKIISRYKQL